MIWWIPLFPPNCCHRSFCGRHFDMVSSILSVRDVLYSFALPLCVFDLHPPENVPPILSSAPNSNLYLPFSICFLRDWASRSSCSNFLVLFYGFYFFRVFDPGMCFGLLPACIISWFCWLMMTNLLPTFNLPVNKGNLAFFLLQLSEESAAALST